MLGKMFALVLLGLVTFSSSANGIRLAFSGRDLPSMDIFDGAPDAYVIVYYAASSTAPYDEQGETDNISDNRNPDWDEVFDIADNGNSGQMLKFEVYDSDSPDSDDYMGYVEIRYSEILNDSDGVLTSDLIGGNGDGDGQLLIKRQGFAKVAQ